MVGEAGEVGAAISGDDAAGLFEADVVEVEADDGAGVGAGGGFVETSLDVFAIVEGGGDALEEGIVVGRDGATIIAAEGGLDGDGEAQGEGANGGRDVFGVVGSETGDGDVGRRDGGDGGAAGEDGRRIGEGPEEIAFEGLLGFGGEGGHGGKEVGGRSVEAPRGRDERGEGVRW